MNLFQVAGFGGVWGKPRLNAANISDAIPATMKIDRFTSMAAPPSSDVPSALPIQVVKPTFPIAGTLAQSIRIKMNGHDAAIQPMVPQTRTG